MSTHLIDLLPDSFARPTAEQLNTVSSNQTISPQADNPQADKQADANNKTHWLLPPLVDLCARLREPGFQQHGTLKSEGNAARKNGFLHVVTPPDSNPILESGSLLKGLRERAWNDGGIHLHILGALTAGLEGERPANVALSRVAVLQSPMRVAPLSMTW